MMANVGLITYGDICMGIGVIIICYTPYIFAFQVHYYIVHYYILDLFV